MTLLDRFLCGRLFLPWRLCGKRFFCRSRSDFLFDWSFFRFLGNFSSFIITDRSVSLRLFAGFAPAFFSVSFTFSASEPAADLLTGGFLAAGLSSAAPFLDTDDSAGLTATLLSALSTGFASACSASFFAAIFLARCLSRFHCFLQSRQTAYSLKIGSPDSVVPTCLFIRSSSLPHDGHFILIMYSSPCQ